MLSINKSIVYSVIPIFVEEMSCQEFQVLSQIPNFIPESHQLIEVRQVPSIQVLLCSYPPEFGVNNISEDKIIREFYQKHCVCIEKGTNPPQINTSNAQDCTFYIPLDQKIRNHQELQRSEDIEGMGLSKYEMYKLLLQPYHHECIIQTDEQNFKVKYLYRCKYGDCNMSFTKGWNILDHVRMHEDIRPYQCEFCNRAFTQKCNLTKHRQRHLVTDLKERKRFKCRICEKSFTERYNLKVKIFEKCEESLQYICNA